MRTFEENHHRDLHRSHLSSPASEDAGSTGRQRPAGTGSCVDHWSDTVSRRAVFFECLWSLARRVMRYEKGSPV